MTWDIFKYYFGEIPGIKFNANESSIRFPNGAVIYILGADNPDNIRGLHFDYVVLDEVADMPNEIWVKVILPALAQKDGGALFIGTPKGHNLFHQLYLMGKTTPGWASILKTIVDTGHINSERWINLDQYQYVGNESALQQEMYCSFEAALEGSYFIEPLTYLAKQSKIGVVPYKKGHDVITAWDIGRDGTAIWYAQIVDNQVNIIDFDFFIDWDVKDCLNIIKGKPYIYKTHFLPHDAVKVDFKDKRKEASVEGQIKAAGYRTMIVNKASIRAKIIAAKSFLPRCAFDVNACTKLHPTKPNTQVGLPSLYAYRSRKDKRSGMVDLDNPVHDDHSHPADAFCYLALGLMTKDNEYDRTFYNDNRRTDYKVKSTWNILKGTR